MSSPSACSNPSSSWQACQYFHPAHLSLRRTGAGERCEVRDWKTTRASAAGTSCYPAEFIWMHFISSLLGFGVSIWARLALSGWHVHSPWKGLFCLIASVGKLEKERIFSEVFPWLSSVFVWVCSVETTSAAKVVFSFFSPFSQWSARPWHWQMETRCSAQAAGTRVAPHWQGGFTSSGVVSHSQLKSGDAITTLNCNTIPAPQSGAQPLKTQVYQRPASDDEALVGEWEKIKNGGTWICGTLSLGQSLLLAGRWAAHTNTDQVVVRSKAVRSVFVSPPSLSAVICSPLSSLHDLHSSKWMRCCRFFFLKRSTLHLALTCTLLFLSSS